MTFKSGEDFRDVAVELADHLYSGEPDRERVLSLLAKIPPVSNSDAVEAKHVPDEPAPSRQRIGIWQRPSEGIPIFSRDLSRRGEWPQWADVHEIRGKGERKRVLLLGESVARGYFYDPYYTVARELEAILNCNGKWTGVEFEVVDLARSNIGKDELLGILQASTVLSADAIVIFAGNNWGVNLSDDEYKVAYRFFNHGSFDGLKEFIDDKYRKSTVSFLSKVREEMADTGIPVIFVIPEFNLRDWKSDEIEKILPWLPDNKTLAWIEARDAAECALANGEMELFREKAASMVSLDPSNPLGFEYLAQYLGNVQQWGKARDCLEAARDTCIAGRSRSSKPRCLKIVRETILAEAAAYGIGVVDLPGIFKEVFDNRLPDRDLFLDYCHLTVLGIKVAMKYTGQKVIEAVMGIMLKATDIIESKVLPDREVQAIAHFSAAIHNAHYGQARDIIEYQCNKAVCYSSAIADTMLQYADFSTRHASTVLCKSFEALISAGRMRVYEGGFALRHRRNAKLMDISLVDSIIKALDSVGIRRGPGIGRLRVQEHGVGDQAVNLLQSFYAKSSYNSFNLGYETNYLAARSDKTRISFVAGGDKSIGIEMTYRTPGTCMADKKIKIHINGQASVSKELEMSKKWVSVSYTIGREVVLNGVNELVIIWPYVYAPLGSLAANVEDSFFTSIFPVLGQISRLTAIACK